MHYKFLVLGKTNQKETSTENTSRMNTSLVGKYNLLEGNKLYQARARVALPYLVKQAEARQTIYYSDLAKILEMPNPRNLNYVLGVIGNAMKELSLSTDIKIPPIQCIAISKRTNLPGDGISWFIDIADYSTRRPSQQKEFLDAMLAEIYLFPFWREVLHILGLDPVQIELQEELYKAGKIKSGGESESHKKFKEFVSKNPLILGLKNSLPDGILEYVLPSADVIDILFIDQSLKIGVEVKSHISPPEDILRGIFQCVKYKHLIEAVQITNNQLPNSRVILALEGKLPEKYVITKNLLGIEVIENILMS